MIGFDCGTYNLVACNSKDKKPEREINAFITLSLDNPEGGRRTFNIMSKNGVKLVEMPNENCAYAFGENAVNIAYTLGLDLKRPMKDGCLNPRERLSHQMMSLVIHELLSKCVTKENEKLIYSVPANAVNEKTDADYHAKVLQSIFNDFNIDEDGKVIGPTVNAKSINEALALVYGELAHKNFTGIGISFGAGMVNLCFSMFGMEVFQFSIVNSGDWIDQMAAKAAGESVVFANKEKHKVDFTVQPSTPIQRALYSQYEIMMEHTVRSIKTGLEQAGTKTRTDSAIDIVVAGGTSLPNGFDKKFEKILRESKLPINIGDVIRPAEPLYSVARGCLVAAEHDE